MFLNLKEETFVYTRFIYKEQKKTFNTKLRYNL